MATTLTRQSWFPCPPGVVRLRSRLTSFGLIAFALLIDVPVSLSQAAVEFHRTLPVVSAQPVTLEVEVSEGDLQVFYGRDGQVSISATARTSNDTRLDDSFFSRVLTIDQRENHLTVLQVPNAAYSEAGVSVSYRIDVPYRTELTSRLNRGHQDISGIMGPVKAAVGTGDIKVDYITKGLQAEVNHGNLDIQVIGEHVEAKAESGSISCARIPQGVSAETEDGDITLMVVGSSTAIVKSGAGRIEVGGARGSIVGSTDRGNLHVKAVPHQDWQLSSASGDVRVEIPPSTNFELEASTRTGELQFDRDDITKPDTKAQELHQAIHGGGKRVTVHTESGRIAIR